MDVEWLSGFGGCKTWWSACEGVSVCAEENSRGWRGADREEFSGIASAQREILLCDVEDVQSAISNGVSERGGDERRLTVVDRAAGYL